MPASNKISGQAVTTPDKLICSLDISAGGDLPIAGMLTVQELFISYDRNPSTASIQIPLGGLNPEVLNDLLHDMRVSVSMVKNVGGSAMVVPMLNGNVVRDRSIINKKHNSLIVQAADERIKLNSWKIMGRVAAKENGVDPVYQMGFPSWFNRGGLRDGWRTTGGNLMFAPYQEFATNGSDAAINFSQADILEYVATWFAKGTYPDTIKGIFPQFDKFPDTVLWPNGFGAGIDQAAWNGAAFQQGNSSQGSNRNGRDFSIDGVGFLDWMEALLAGTGLRLDLQPNGDLNEMILVPLRPNDQNAVRAIIGDPRVGPTDVDFERNSEDTLTQTTVAGNNVEQETRVSMENEA